MRIKTALSAAVLLSFLLTPITALAVDSTTTGSLKDQMQQKRTDLKAARTAFKDQKKATLLEKVSTNLNKINKNRTDHFSKFLDKAEKILTRLEERVNKAGTQGKDTTSAKSAIASARVAISTARSAVVAQAAKDYTVTATDETKARAAAQAMHQQLRSDLEATRQSVMDAKKAVSNAIKVAMSSLGKSGTKESTRGATNAK